MANVKVNTISKASGNNVAMDCSLNLKSYTTTQRDALSSPQAGWTVFNSTTNKINQYNGSAWEEVGGASIGLVIALGE